MRVLAIDPGYEQSAWVCYEGGAYAAVAGHGIERNEAILTKFNDERLSLAASAIVFEQIESFGMAVGREVFETVFWTGRLYEAASPGHNEQHTVERMPRRTVKIHLCGSARAQDSNIRVALIDRFGGTEKAIGKKKTPGPLYGIKSHEWAALAIAVTWWDQKHF